LFESEKELPFALSHTSIELEELCRSPERCFSNAVMVFIVETVRCGDDNEIGLRGDFAGMVLEVLHDCEKARSGIRLSECQGFDA
jgi:hypothetical protein